MAKKLTNAEKAAILQISRQIGQLLRDKNYSTNPKDYTSDELQMLLTYEGFGGVGANANEGDILSEFYTPTELVRLMWQLCCSHGFEGGKVLEPSCGIGRFFNSAARPNECELVGYEKSPVSATIASLLNPTATIRQAYFEEHFIKNNASVKNKVAAEFDLVIGNPPYGKFEGIYAGMGEAAHTQAQNYPEYFISRGLDVLKSGGLLCLIVGGIDTTFLGNGHNKGKELIHEKAELIDAYQLPAGAFFNTDAITQIVVFKKR